MPVLSRIPTSRLTLRCWKREDAAQLRESILSSLRELQAAASWASEEPRPLAETERRLAEMRSDFEAGRAWSYGIFDLAESMVIGGLELRPDDPGVLEMSYWIRTSCTGRGYATEAVCAATAHAFSDGSIQRLVIRCHCQNRRGAAIPERLGYTLTGTIADRAGAPDAAPREALLWELTRSSFRSVAALPGRSQRPWLS